MGKSNCIISAAGIDYITLTSMESVSQSRMISYFNEIAAGDRALGYPLLNGGANGFVGKQTRHALLGWRGERCMLRVSGSRSQRAFLIADARDNCTRLDIQLTVQIARGQVPRFLDALEMVTRNHKPLNGRQPEVRAIHGATGNETVYVGKRSSEVFIRCYNKFLESGEERYRDCVRLEVELKGSTSKRIWRYLAENSLGPGFLIGILCYFINRRGISTDWIDLNTFVEQPPEPQRKRSDVTMAWLATQVAPSVRRMCAERSWQETFRSLFSDTLTTDAMSCILSLVSVSY